MLRCSAGLPSFATPVCNCYGLMYETCCLASTKLHLYSQSCRCVTTFPVIITNSWSQTRDLLNTSPMPEPSRHRPLFSSPAQPVCFPKITPGYAGFPLGHPMKKPLKTDGARFFTGRMHFGHPVIQLTGHSTDT